MAKKSEKQQASALDEVRRHVRFLSIWVGLRGKAMIRIAFSTRPYGGPEPRRAAS
jgi:hypothetical protein